jgi:TRAP-type C4-dicarboxylate transport system substrate-binding protein
MKTIKWVIAHEPIDLFLKAAQRFSNSVKEKTNGKIDIEILSLTEYSQKYNQGKKVTKHDLLQLMEEGVVEMSQMYTTWLGHYNRDMFVLDLPFLFRDHDHADRVLEGEIGEYILKGLEKGSAVRGLAFTYSGGYRIIPANKELSTVESFKGTKIRTSRSPVAIDTFNLLGAEVNSKVELEEMNEAADSGVIEAGESTFVRVIPLKQNESFKYVNDTAHSLFLTSIIIATKFWDTLTVEIQQIMKDAALDAARAERKEAVDQIPEIIEDCKKHQVPVVSMDKQETEKFKELTSPLYSKYKNYFSDDLISKIQKF